MPVLDFFENDLGGQTVKNLRFDVGATLPVLRVRVLDGNDPVDLTGATATFTMRDRDGVAKILNAAAIVEGDGTSGIVRYVWTSADTNLARIYFGQFTITLSGDDRIVPNDADQVLRIVMGKADFQRGTVIQQPVAQGIQVVALGGTPTLDAIGRWFKVVVSALDFTAAAASESIDLFQLPAGGIVEAVKAKHSAAFAGGTITAYTVEVGSATQTPKYMSPFDVFSAPSATNHRVATSGDEESHSAPTPIKVTAKATGGNVNDATVGTVEIWVKASTVLASGGLLFSDGIEAQDDGAIVAGGPFKIINFKSFVVVVDEGGGIVAVTAPTGNSAPDDLTLEDTGSVLRIKALGVSAAELAASAVTNVKLAANAVTNAKVQQFTLDRRKLLSQFQTQHINKTSDEDKTLDTALAVDSELALSLNIAEDATFEIGVFIEVGDMVPGFKFDLNYTAALASIRYGVIDFGEGLVSFNGENIGQIITAINTQVDINLAGGGTGTYFLLLKGHIRVSAAGLFEFRWAQLNSSGSFTRVTEGSYIKANFR